LTASPIGEACGGFAENEVKKYIGVGKYKNL
jgi:hypothetical protein